MQFRLSTLLWATLVVATSLGLAGGWGVPFAVGGIAYAWWFASGCRHTHAGVASIFFWRSVVGVLLCLPAIGVIFLVLTVRSDLTNSVCANHLRHIDYALWNYRDRYHSFPPAAILDASGAPMHSWRTAILQDLEDTKLYSRYDWTQPWNVGSNARVSAQQIPEYLCGKDNAGSGKPFAGTNYVAVVGPDTVWDPSISYPNGHDSRIVVVEVAQSGIAWAEPRDISSEEFLTGIQLGKGNGPGLRSPHRDGVYVVLVDCRVEFIPAAAPQELLETLLYAGLTQDAHDQLARLQAESAARNSPLRHFRWRLLAWVASIAAFGVHAFRFRRGQAQSAASTESVGNAPRE